MSKLYAINMKEQKSDTNATQKKVDKLQKRHDEINNLIKKTFEKNVAGILDDEFFSSLLNDYKTERAEVEVNLNELRLHLLKLESHTTDIQGEVAKLKEFTQIKTRSCTKQSDHAIIY